MDDQEAEEVVQDVFVALWSKREELDPDQNLQSYIFTIAKNRCLNFIRKKINERKYIDKVSLQEAVLNRDALLDESYDRLNTSELALKINRIKNGIPSKSLEIFKMSRNENMTYDEISDSLGLSKKAVEYHMSKVLACFREKLKEYVGIFVIIFLG